MDLLKHISIGIILVLVLISLVACFLQDKLVFFPEKLPADYTFNFPYPFEEVFIDTSDGGTIHGLFFPAENSKGIILYFHGNAGSLRSWGGIAPDFLKHNYSTFIIDYRGFGKSHGTRNQTTFYSDAVLAYDYLSETYPEKNIVIYGRSIGSAAASYAAAKRRPALLILESPFTELRDVARRHYPGLHLIPLRYTFPNYRYIEQIESPLVIFHGSEDRLIPPDMGEELGSIRGNENGFQSTFYSIEGAGHNDVPLSTEYQVLLSEVLNNAASSY